MIRMANTIKFRFSHSNDLILPLAKSFQINWSYFKNMGNLKR